MTGASGWDGLGLHVEDSGSGEPVLLLHSSGMSSEQWRRTADALVRGGRRAIAPDLLGSGRSPPWPEGKPFGFRDDVDRVVRLLGRLDGPAHLVGHSYGGFVALHVALRQPVRSIAVYDPVGFGLLEAGRDADALADLARIWFGWGASAVEHEAWLRAFVDYWGGEGAWERLREPARAAFARVGWIVHEGARSLATDATAAAAYRSIAIPALLMTGERSPLAARRVVERLGEALPDARLERFAGAGHMGPLTHTTRFNELLAGHLARAARLTEAAGR